MSASKDDERRVSWAAVSDLARQIEGAHCCNIELRMRIPSNRDTGVQFWLSARAEPRIVGRKTIRQPVAVAHRWPTSEAATLAGLAFQLLYKLDRDLDENGHLPAEQATFLWGTES